MPLLWIKALRRTAALSFCLIIFLSACGLTATPPTSTTDTPAAASPAAPADSQEPSQNPSDGEEVVSEYYQPFSPSITATIARVTDPTATLPKGMTWEDNVWTKAYAEKLGVTFEAIWTGEADEFSEALDAMIAAGNLPDYMDLNYDDFYKLMQRGLLEPIERYVDAYATPQVLAALNAYDGAAREIASADGHLLGITAAPPRDGAMLWIRDDWLATSGKSLPTTFEEVIELAYEFAGNETENGPTVGFALSQMLFMGENEVSLGLDGIFSAFGAYPTQWLERDGKLIHGSTDPNIKPVLELLQKWYADGIIDPDFDTVDRWDGLAQREIFSERAGMAFGAEWFGEFYAPNLMNIKQSLSPTWTCIPIPGSSGAPNNVPTIARQGNVTCIRAGFAYPELPVRMVNLTRSLLGGELAAPEYRFVLEDNIQRDTVFLSMASGGHKTDSAGSLSSAKNEIATLVAAAMSGSDPENYLIAQDVKYIYDRSVAWKNRKDPNSVDYRLFVTFAPGGSQSVLSEMRARSLFQPNSYYGPETPALRENMASLSELMNEAFTKIIKGANVDSAFERYVDEFNENGGEACTRDVNVWFEALK